MRKSVVLLHLILPADISLTSTDTHDTSDNRALITLDISSNRIGAEQKGGLQRICVASGIDLAM
jgi:hypothetical protein